MQRKKITIILIAFFILLSAAFMMYYYKEMKAAPKRLKVVGNDGHTIDTFTFINQEGQRITKKDVEGKILVVEYFFATCKGICPKMNENMAKVYQAFRGNNDILILSHTVDPEKDSAAALKAYSLKFDADPKQWMFLTGDKQELYNKARYSYLISAQDDTAGLSIDKDFIHDKHFVLVDKGGRLRGGFYDGLDNGSINQLIGDIKELLKEKE